MIKRINNIIIIVIILLCMGISIASVKAEEEPDIVKIVIESEKDKIMVGNDKAKFYAMVVTSNGEIVRNSEYSKVRWYVQTKFEKKPLKIRVNETSRLVEDKSSKYYGCYCVTLKAPYGFQSTVCRIFAENIKLPMFDQEKEFYFITDYNDKHFMHAKKGKVEYGTIEGDAPVVHEKYDYDRNAYLITFPKNKYTSYYNEFVGWGYEGKVYQPGQTIYVDVNSTNRKIVAQWKEKFKSPDLYVTKRNNGLGISWNTIAGANKGYKIYRKIGEKGKYKLIKSYWHYAMTFFEDKNVKKGKVYTYKVKAIKRDNGKTFYKTSNWAKMTTNHTNVKYIKFNKKRVAGIPGKVVTLKAKVKRYRRRISTEKVRWYSTDKSVAKINKSTGKLKLLKKGKCRIYVLSFNGQKRGNIMIEVR